MLKRVVFIGAFALTVATLVLLGRERPAPTAPEEAAVASSQEASSPASRKLLQALKSRASAPPAFVRAPVAVDYGVAEQARSTDKARALHDDQLRDEAWAPRTEAVLHGQLARDVERLVPGAKIEVDCRTLSCRVELSGVAEKDREAAMAALQIAPVAQVMEFATAENGTIVAHAFFTAPNRDLDKWPTWYADLRAKRLQELRALKTPVHPALANLPNE